MRSLARWGSLLIVAAPLEAWALGLGEIESSSYLNEPLDAEIQLNATAQELNGLRVAMAPVERYTAVGLDYPAVLSSIEFSIGVNDRGQNVIHVESDRLITETFLTFIIEVRSGRSTTYGEYSVLLDPPTFRAQDTAPETIAAPAVRDPAPAVAGGQVQRTPAPAPPQVTAPSQTQTQTPAPTPAPAAQPPAAGAVGGDYTVPGGDTLWRIAESVRPSTVSTNQAMMSIYAANPGAFDGNINRLRRGAILRIPPAADLATLSAAAATAEVRRQNEAWQGGADAEGRLVLRAPSEAADAGAALSANASAEVAELESAVSDLAAELATTRAQLAETERLLEIRDAELANVQNLIEATQQAADAAEAAAATAEDSPFADAAGDEAAADEAAAAEAVAADDSAANAVPASVPDASTAASGPSIVDQIISILSNGIVLAAAAVVVIVIGALAFLRRRRDDDDLEDVTGQWEALEAELDEEADQATARIRSRITEPDMVVVEGAGAAGAIDAAALESDIDLADSLAEVPETDVFADDEPAGTMEIPAPIFPEEDDELFAADDTDPPLADQTLSSQTVINLDHDDPIAEADFHMAYGLYDQAAELITKALAADPDNLEFRQKLLEVYFVWGNKDQFLEQAQLLHEQVGGQAGSDWDKVVIMGKQICPDEPLFSAATAAAGEVDLDLEASMRTAGLDLSFEDGEGQGLDLDLGDDGDVELSLEPSGAHEARVEASGRREDTLELGARTQAGLEAAFLDDDDDNDDAGQADGLDAGSTQESPTLETPTVEAAGIGGQDGGDTIEQPRPASPGVTADLTAEIELDDLGLDVGDLEGLADDAEDEAAEISAADDSSEIAFVLDDDDDADVGDDIASGSDTRAASTLSATGVTQVLDVESDADADEMSATGTAIFGREETNELLSEGDDDSPSLSTQVLEKPVGGFERAEPETEDDLDLNLDDFSSALGGGSDTIEQPVASGFGNVDLDVGADIGADDEPTGTEEYSPLDPQTMTEVGTKLDLARAYIDMGDPEGARSILDEVLSEGDSTQRTEARSLIESLDS